MTLTNRYGTLLLILAFALLAPLAACAQTILVSAQESAGGSILPAPNAAAEGAEAGLYDSGFVVFESAPAGPPSSPADLAKVAREGGSDLLLVLTVDYESSSAAGGSATTAQASWSLLDPATSAELAKGTETGSNQGRETTVDRGSLGQELGRAVASKVAAAVAALAQMRR